MPEPRLDSDVIVIGGGVAGMVAANRAAELGKNVIVLEKGTEDRYLCNSRFTGGSFHVCMRDMLKGHDYLYNEINTVTSGTARKSLASAIAKDAIRLVKWLQGKGIKFISVPGAPHQRFVLAPLSRTGPGLDWEGRGGDVLLRTFEANLNKAGGRIMRGVRALSLDNTQPKVITVETKGSSGSRTFRATAVVIADGGFQSNLDMINGKVTRAPQKILQRGAGKGVGDGLKMAQALGAKITATDCFYGHLLSRDAMTNQRLWPRPYLDSVVTAGIVVGSDGKRFADEGLGGIYMANAVGRLDDPLSATAICDQTIWMGPGKSNAVAANPHLLNAGGTLLEADTIVSLAEIAKLPAGSLKQSVDAYNAALNAGNLGHLAPPRSTTSDKFKPFPIIHPPFYAIPLCTGITYTMGGIAVDENAAVLDQNEIPIPGLYAAGGSIGGVEGGPNVGYVGGLSIAGVTGLRAAEKIAGVAET